MTKYIYSRFSQLKDREFLEKTPIIQKYSPIPVNTLPLRYDSFVLGNQRPMVTLPSLIPQNKRKGTGLIQKEWATNLNP